MKCEICGEEAVYRFSPDLDIQGLRACEKHKEDMQVAYIILIQQGRDKYEKFIKPIKNKKLKSK
jgi:hypothetical protein